MRTDFSGREIVKALTKNRFYIHDRTGSHVKLRYEHPTNEDDVRMVSVPMHDSINIGTLRNIADQSGADEFVVPVDRPQLLKCPTAAVLNGLAGVSPWHVKESY